MALSLTGLAWIALECRFNLVALLGLVPCLSGLALAVAPGWCGSAGREAGAAIWLPAGASAPRAPLSELDSRIVAERWDEAEAQARALCGRYPEDPEVWLRRLRLAWREPVDLERARAAHRAALARLTDAGGREAVNRFYLLFAESRIADEERLEEERVAFARRCAWGERGGRVERKGSWRWPIRRRRKAPSQRHPTTRMRRFATIALAPRDLKIHLLQRIPMGKEQANEHT